MTIIAVQTTRGLHLERGVFLRGDTPPTNFKAVLCGTTNPPTIDTKLLSELSALASANGYAPLTIERSAVGWPTHVEDDTLKESRQTSKPLLWTATGAGVGPFRYVAVCTDADAVCWFLDLGDTMFVSGGEDINLDSILAAAKALIT